MLLYNTWAKPHGGLVVARALWPIFAVHFLKFGPCTSFDYIVYSISITIRVIKFGGSVVREAIILHAFRGSSLLISNF